MTIPSNAPPSEAKNWGNNIQQFWEILTIVWFTCSIAGLLYWLRRNRGPIAALRDAPQRPHSLGVFELFLTFIGLLAIKLLVYTVSPQESQRLHYCLHIATQVLTICLVLIIAWRFFEGGLAGFGLRKDKPAHTLLGGLVLFFIAAGLTHLTLLLTQQICKLFGYEQVQQHEFLKTLIENPDIVVRVCIAAIAVVLTPIEEELLFRGVLQSLLVRFFARPGSVLDSLPFAEPTMQIKTPDATIASPKHRWLAILATSAMFAAMHSAANWQHWPALFVLSICLGYSYEKHRDILIPIIGHAMFNGLSVGSALLTAGF